MYRASITAFCLLAFILRAHHLDFESFWIDEADAVRIASAPISELIARLTQVGENGPLYHIVLRGWMAFTGTTEFAVRFLSLLAGVLTVPIMGALGHRLGGKASGAAAALITACSSYLIFYGQEAKMYSLVVMLAALSGFLLVRAFDENRKLLWLSFLIVTSLTMYTHVFGALLIPASFVYAISRPKAHWKSSKGFALAFAGLTLPYLPLGLWQLKALQLPKAPVGSYYGAPSLDEMIKLILEKFGTIQPGVPGWQVWLVFGGLTLLGALPLIRGAENDRKRFFFTIAYFAVPCVLAAMLFSRIPIFLDRYMSPVLPAMFIAIAGSTAFFMRFWKPLGAAPIALVLAFNTTPWVDAHIQNVLLKEAWRPATQYVDGRIDEGDLVVFVASDSWIGYDYYASRPYVKAGGSEIPSKEPKVIDEYMKKLIAGKKRIWLVLAKYAQEDVDMVEGWLNKNATKVDSRGFRDVLVSTWLPEPPAPGLGSATGKVSFDGTMALLSIDAGTGGNEVTARCTKTPVECSVKLSLVWQAQRVQDRDLRISTKLIDDKQQIWGQFDFPPNPYYPTSSWRQGWIYREERYVPVLPGTPAGNYRLTAVAYDPETSEALPAKDASGANVGVEVTIGTVVVQQPTGGWSSEPVGDGYLAQLGGIQVAGASLSPSEVGAGQQLHFLTTLNKDGQKGLKAVVSLKRDGAVVAEWPVSIRDGAGVVAEQATLQVSGAVPSGKYEASFRLMSGSTTIQRSGLLPFGGSNEISLGSIQVTRREATFSEPAVQRRLDAKFRDDITLIGYSMTQRIGDTDRPADSISPQATSVSLTLYWKAGHGTAAPLSVFTHVTDLSGQPRAQHDGIPGGAVLSTGWLPGEIIADKHVMPLNGLPAGRYTLIAGLYESISGKRLSTESGTDFVTIAPLDR